MSADVVIRAEGLGKKYVLGHETEKEAFATLRDVLARSARTAWNTTRDVLRGKAIVQGHTTEEFWALRDVSFEVKRGEVLGIIGRNGAGKSTLLKLLARITEPSEGRLTIDGRVASLLEVGTGFHPELTGRENVYLNGAILGMSHAEIRRKFDEIVAFAEVDRFLDTPVKRYSSGMYVRLAFAVAAHMEPEILIVDEVLAVGDAEFQNKCLGKMGQVSKSGRTVLFVSHDMRKVTSLCDRGLLLNAGAIESEGGISAVADTYLNRNAGAGSSADFVGRSDRSGSGEARFQSIELLNDGRPCRTFPFGDELTFCVKVQVTRPIGPALLNVGVRTPDGVAVHEFLNVRADAQWIADVGNYEFKIRIDDIRLYPGLYYVSLWMGDRNRQRVDFILDAISFDIIETAKGDGGQPLDRSNALVSKPSVWQIEKCR